MVSPIDSSIRDSPSGGALLPAFDFAESGGYSRKEAEEVCTAVAGVSDDLRACLAPKHLQALVPQAPPETAGPGRLPGSSRLDKLYEFDFRRLEELLKAQQVAVPELPKVLEGTVSAQIRLPSSVTQGYVPALDVVDAKAEGGVAFGSVLMERKAGVRK